MMRKEQLETKKSGELSSHPIFCGKRGNLCIPLFKATIADFQMVTFLIIAVFGRFSLITVPISPRHEDLLTR